jgi:hypothetical protein
MLAEDITRSSSGREHCHTLLINAESRPLWRELHDKHFPRKRDRNAYYGQVKTQ